MNQQAEENRPQGHFPTLVHSPKPHPKVTSWHQYLHIKKYAVDSYILRIKTFAILLVLTWVFEHRSNQRMGFQGLSLRCEVAGERYFAVLVYSSVQLCLTKIQTSVPYIIDEQVFCVVSFPCTQIRALRWMTPVLWQLNNVVLRILKQGSLLPCWYTG